MRSPSRNRKKRSFRFRTVLYSMGLTLMLLAVTFGISLFLVHQELRTDAFVQLDRTLVFLTDKYVGSTLENELEKITISQWPPELQASFHRNFPEAKIALIERESQHDGLGYEVIASTGKERLEILISEGGQMWVAHSESVEEIFQALEASLVNPFHDASASGISLLLLDPAGEIIGGTAEGSMPVDRAMFLQQGPEIKSEVRSFGFMKKIFIAQKMYDGNMLCVSDDFSEGIQELRRWGIFLLSLLVVFLPFSFIAGLLLSRHAMEGVKRVAEAARVFDAGHLQQRVQSRRAGAEVEELCQSFNGMASRIEKLVRELREITANIAHDIRTPITRIRGLVETMDWNTASEEERAEISGMVIAECDQLTPLVSDILDMARAETGVMELHREAIDLGAELEKSIEIFSAFASEKQITLEHTFSGASVFVEAERSKIQRMISNLLDNAIKFTPPGSRVEVRLYQNENQAGFEVVDNGPGIPLSDQASVFERFNRGGDSRTIPGNGLGLSLVKAFVELHGGGVVLKPASPHGCVFRVWLPLENVKEERNLKGVSWSGSKESQCKWRADHEEDI
ncbi:HAMP domain-containing sensor histidine kinase [Pontiellaceae bacterium B1224]|nr:HAMP domain-containing sensor histidine kinase [Pontiellaceae bacterium B1224]